MIRLRAAEWLMDGAESRLLSGTRVVVAVGCFAMLASAHARYPLLFDLGWSPTFRGSDDASWMAAPWVARLWTPLASIAGLASFLLAAGLWTRASAIVLCVFANQWNAFLQPAEDLWASSVMAPLLWLAAVGGTSPGGRGLALTAVEAPRWSALIMGGALAVVPCTRPVLPLPLAGWHAIALLSVGAALCTGTQRRRAFALNAPTVLSAWLGLALVAAVGFTWSGDEGTRLRAQELLSDLGLRPAGVPCTAGTAPTARARSATREDAYAIPWPAHPAMACVGAVLHSDDDPRAAEQARARADLRNRMASAACAILGTSPPVDVTLDHAQVPILSFECRGSDPQLVPRHVEDGLSCGSAKQLASKLVEDHGVLRWATPSSRVAPEVPSEVLERAPEVALRSYLNSTCGLDPRRAAQRIVRLAAIRARRLELGEAHELVVVARGLLPPRERRKARFDELLAQLSSRSAAVQASRSPKPQHGI